MQLSPTRVMLIGGQGRMGRLAADALRGEKDMELVAIVNRGDDLARAVDEWRPEVAVDFTTPHVIEEHLKLLVEKRVRPVIGTTGLKAEAIEAARSRVRTTGIGGLIAPNFALGAMLMMEFGKQAARYFPQVEIVEYHHEKKLDAPSGTSLSTRALIAQARESKREIPIHSVRLPGFMAHQEIIFGGPGERLTVRHDALDRACYMPGVLLAVRRVRTLTELVIGLEKLLELHT